MNKFNGTRAIIAAVCLIAMPLCAQATVPSLSAAALYNQGNAYARAGKPGMAVLNYQRAQLLEPGDADLQANLNAVRASQHLYVEPRSRLTQVALIPAPTVAALLGLLGLILCGVGLVAVPRLMPSRKISLAAVAMGMGLMGLTLLQAAILAPLLHAGVVIARQAPVLVSPVPIAETLFTLPEAETVTVLGMHDDFLLVKTLAGSVGWVRRNQLGQVQASVR